MSGKTPYIVGIGPGNHEYIYPLAQKAIEGADVLIGGKRNLEEFAYLKKETVVIDGKLAPVVALIEQQWQEKSIVVLASGDTGLFSIRAYLQKKLPKIPFTVLPGISSLQYLIAKCNVNLNDLKIITLHGNHEVNLRDTVARNPVTAIFTGGSNSPQAIAARLATMNFAKLSVTVGENLSYPNEVLVTDTPEAIAKMHFGDLSLMLVKNNAVDERPWPYHTMGLPDESFLRDEVPMTKSEIRAIISSKLRLKADSKVLEIGAGTGSVTIEAALTAHEGHVWALEKNPAAVELCKKNIERFCLDNVTLIEGTAPEAIPSLSDLDAIFIGGSGGNMKNIIEVFGSAPVRLVVSAITVESVAEALDAMKEFGFEGIEIVQAAVARSKRAGSKHLMMGMNPITILSGERK